MKTYNTIKIEKKGFTDILYIDRPNVLNALNSEVLEEIDNYISSINYNEVKGIIITGIGEKAFVAGADISELQLYAVDSNNKFAEKGLDVFSKIEALQIPVIAAINGFALGGGLELALSCHFKFAAQTAKMGQPEVNLGILPGYGGTVRLREAVGHSKSLQLILTGEMIKADDAFVIGLVDNVFLNDELLSASINFLEEIYKKPAQAVREIMKHFNRMKYLNRNEMFTSETNAFYSLTSTDDFITETTKFLNKSKK